MTTTVRPVEPLPMVPVLLEARCPRCRKLLARNLCGYADLVCLRCKLEVCFASDGTITVLLDKR